MKRLFRASIVLFAGAFLSLGCRSTSSTFMNRYDNDRVGGISNGQRGCHENAKPFKGIPVTMKVPTHVDVTVFETIYLDPTTFKPIPTERRNLSATADTVVSDKIFAVDPKKAAAGETKYSFAMKDGYYTQVKQKVTDETIKDINAALVDLLPLLSPKPAPKILTQNAMGPSTQPETKERVVAWKRFDINSVDFEDQVKQFVDLHINNCNSCCENTTLVQ
jgi:hypothetical protein